MEAAGTKSYLILSQTSSMKMESLQSKILSMMNWKPWMSCHKRQLQTTVSSPTLFISNHAKTSNLANSALI
jgi:hypothetical protein